MGVQIINKSDMDLKEYTPLLLDFYRFMKKKLNFSEDPMLILVDDEENSLKPLCKTAHYEPETYKITIYTTGRLFKDILRSFSHELVHHGQNIRGDFEKMGEYSTGLGYTQRHPGLRKLEKEAYLLGSGIYLRDWEDNKKMSNTLLKEWKKGKNFKIDVSKLLLEEKDKKSEEIELDEALFGDEGDEGEESEAESEKEGEECKKCSKSGEEQCKCVEKPIEEFKNIKMEFHDSVKEHYLRRSQKLHEHLFNKMIKKGKK